MKLIRGLSKLTQGELGELVGEKENNIKAYETRGVNPKPHVLMILAELAGVKEADLLNKKLTLKDIAINKELISGKEDMTTYTKTPIFETKGSDEKERKIREQQERIKELQSQVEKLMEMLNKALEKR